MPSSYSVSLRFTLQATGENNNTWGQILNQGAFQLIDAAVAGWVTKALVGNYALTSVNGAADEARAAMLRFTGAGAFTVTVPAVSKRYDIWNACSDVLTVSNGSGSVQLAAGEAVAVITDGVLIRRVQGTDFGGVRLTGVGEPTVATDAATKNYVDQTAFDAAAGQLPGQPGNAGNFLTTNGAVASWSAVYVLASLTGVGGLSAAYPALKRNGAALDIRLANDSGFAALNAGSITSNGQPVPTTAQAAAQAIAFAVAL
jgi:hypothetical protein